MFSWKNQWFMQNQWLLVGLLCWCCCFVHWLDYRDDAILHMYIMHDCINCLRWRYKASKYRIDLLIIRPQASKNQQSWGTSSAYFAGANTARSASPSPVSVAKDFKVFCLGKWFDLFRFITEQKTCLFSLLKCFTIHSFVAIVALPLQPLDKRSTTSCEIWDCNYELHQL